MLEKCLKKTLDSKIRVFSNPPFYAPTLCHPLSTMQVSWRCEGGAENTAWKAYPNVLLGGKRGEKKNMVEVRASFPQGRLWTVRMP